MMKHDTLWLASCKYSSLYIYLFDSGNKCNIEAVSRLFTYLGSYLKELNLIDQRKLLVLSAAKSWMRKLVVNISGALAY